MIPVSMEIENHSGVKFCRTWVIVETGRSLAVAVSSFVCVSPIADCRTDCVDGFEKCVLTKFRSGEISIFEESVPVMMTQIRRLLVDGCGMRHAATRRLRFCIIRFRANRFEDFDRIQIRQLHLLNRKAARHQDSRGSLIKQGDPASIPEEMFFALQ